MIFRTLSSALLGATATLMLLTPAAAPAQGGYADRAKAAVASATSQDIVATAIAAGQFKTLATALTAADLVKTLQGEGPFTVFAPTDEAFKKLPAGALEALLADKEALKQVLLFHVVPGNVKAADVVKLEKAKTAQGSDVTIKVEDGKVRVNGALVTKTDIAASNGTIHVIDTVILPPAVAEAAAKANIVQTAVAAGQFKTLATALTAAGLVETLAGEGPFTVFAPTDDAFAKLPAGTLEALLADKEALKKVLLHHVVPGTVKAADVVKLTSAKTAAGTDLAVKVDEGKVHIGAATVVKADVEAANGVIHVIDTVLVP